MIFPKLDGTDNYDWLKEDPLQKPWYPGERWEIAADTARGLRSQWLQESSDDALVITAQSDIKDLADDLIAATEEIAKFRRALEWYAGNNSWKDYGEINQHHPKIRDCGKRARAALGMPELEAEE